MIRFEQMEFTAAIHPGQMGERWQASAARAHIPAPHTAASMLRSAWCKPDWRGEWPAAMSFAAGAAAVWELVARGGGARSGEA
jgi:hypothetical protein